MTTLFRRILVPHDFSAEATRALQVAAGLAAGHRGRLVILNAIPPVAPVAPLAAGTGGVPWVPPDDLIVTDRRRLEALVARTVGRRRGAPRTECRVVIGDPVERILDAARDVDSVVMATAGRTGLSRLLMGSVAEKVVRQAPVPVLTLRPGAARARKARSTRAGGRRRTRRKR